MRAREIYYFFGKQVGQHEVVRRMRQMRGEEQAVAIFRVSNIRNPPYLVVSCLSMTVGTHFSLPTP